MNEEKTIRNISYKFAIRIVQLFKYLCDNKKEYILSKQILRSGTSIGANIEESIGGQSGKDFLSKINIAYKEARETHYWLRILRDTGYINASVAESMLRDCEDLLRMTGSTIRTMKKKLNK